MSTDRETTRIVRSWLEEGVTKLPDRVLDAVLDQVPATPQRRSWWPARRFATMNRHARRLSIAAAAVVIAVAAYTLAPRVIGPGGGGQTPSPAPSVSPRPSTAGASPGPWVLHDGPLAAHDYFVRPFATPNDTITFTFSVPDGWFGAMAAVAPPTGFDPPAGSAIGFLRVTQVHSDPCHWKTDGEPAPGFAPNVDDLVSALAGQVGESTEPTDTTLAGFPGQRLDLIAPADLQACDDGEYWFFEAEGMGIRAQGPGDRFHLVIVDVDGTTIAVLSRDFAATPADDVAAIDAIRQSIRIDR
jgi:hypothetical protein